MAAGRLDVLLGLDAAEFTSGLTKAEYDAKKFRDNLGRLGSQIGTALGAGFIAAATGIGLLTKSSIDAADRLNDLSKATGVTVENLGGIGFAASQAGSDLDGVAQAFGKLNLKIAEAARGEKEAAEAFRAIGVAVKDANGQTRTAEAIFKDIATAFEGYADGPEKAALGNALFGKSYQAILPLLADGGKALQENIDYYKQFGGVTTETAKAADAFNDTLGKLELVTGQLGRKLATELLPPLQAVADEILSFAEQSGAFDTVAKAARVAFETIAILFANVKFVFEGVGREIAAIAAQLTALANRDFKGFRAISEAVKEDGIRARKELDALEQRILGLAAGPSLASRIGTVNPDREILRGLRSPKPPAPSLGGPTTGGGKPAKAAVDETAQAYAKYVEQLTRTIEKSEDLTNVQRVQRDIEQSIGIGLGVLTDQQKEYLLSLAAANDELDERAKKVAHNALVANEFLAASQARKDRLDELTGATQAKRDLQDLILLQEELNLRGDEFLDDFIKATNKIAGFDKELDKANDTAQELGMTFSSALEDAIVDFTSLREIVSGLEKDLVRIITRKLVTEPLADWASNFAKGLGGGGGGGIGSFIGSLFGGGGQSMVGVFAGGTDYVQRDGMAMVHRGERIVTAKDNRRGSSSSTVFNFNLSGAITRETASQIEAAAYRGQARANRRLN